MERLLINRLLNSYASLTESQFVKKRIVVSFLIVVALVSLSCGLDFRTGPEDPPEEVTKFIEFRFVPSDTVQAGESVTVYAIIEDSLKESIRFRWVTFGEEQITAENFLTIETSVNDSWETTNGSLGIYDEERTELSPISKSFTLYLLK